MRRIMLLAAGFVFGCPLLARADALDGAFFVLQLLAAVWGLALVGVVFSGLAYRWPAARLLQISHYVVNGLCLLLGLTWLLVFSRNSGGSFNFGDLNPFMQLSVPVAVWLGAANKVAYRTSPAASTWWVAAAVTGAALALNGLLFGLLRWLLPGSLLTGFGGAVWSWLLAPASLFGIWWLVLRQAQRFQPLNWPARAVWLVPAWALLLSIAWNYLPLLPVLPDLVLGWGWFVGLLGHSLVSSGVGAGAIWLTLRRYQMAA